VEGLQTWLRERATAEPKRAAAVAGEILRAIEGCGD
jgi:hypothetical protein